ncbi:hypothetical protein ACQYWQ_01605 [Streptomyces sp. P6-2-1]|uniref:hypothetical protein n=1 Tax=Streptomyces sp. P6-2-1 TaxID=3422591 RepID=UPI003D35B0F0
MPHFTMRVDEAVLDGATEPRLQSALTDAVGSVFGPELRALAAVDLIGLPAHRRSVGGKTVAGPYPVVVLSLREGAYHLPHLPDAPARLVAAITEAVTGVLGEEVREQLVITLEGVPEGRGGIAGKVV